MSGSRRRDRTGRRQGADVVDDELPASMRLRDYLARNWAVVLATALFTLVMVVSVATLF